ncbi:MAG TPA: hypothetical protein VHS80_09635 [Chthoniobacterales bacterium]|nr:hypothetical protein [Chthoniobacterales bacterium]
MKVAQYEVLGWSSEKASRPGRDDRFLATLAKSRTGDQAPTVRSFLRDGLAFLFRPGTAYRTTFVASLRDGTIF